MVKTKDHVLIIVTVAIIASLLYFYFDPSFSKLFPPCPFYRLTGLFCPGCGSQRAFHDILHGDVAGAAGHNILFVLFLPLVAYSAIVTVNNIFSRKKIGQQLFRSGIFTWGVLIVVVLFWVLRNIHAAPFNVLAP